jgi:hypothetical protein
MYGGENIPYYSAHSCKLGVVLPDSRVVSRKNILIGQNIKFPPANPIEGVLCQRSMYNSKSPGKTDTFGKFA